MNRIRLVFQKRAAACFVRHVELPQLFGRIARRAGLKVQLTQGISPHPHIVIGAALPVGVVSLYELAEIRFADPLAPSEILAKMNAASPGGFRFIKAAQIPPDAPSLGKSYDAADWWLCPRDTSKIQSAAQELQKKFGGQTLLSIKIHTPGTTPHPGGSGAHPAPCATTPETAKKINTRKTTQKEIGIEISTRDPADTGPASFVKILIASGNITGWPEVCIARLSLGNWNTERNETEPLI